jgi:hypothetical protein
LKCEVRNNYRNKRVFKIKADIKIENSNNNKKMNHKVFEVNLKRENQEDDKIQMERKCLRCIC